MLMLSKTIHVLALGLWFGSSVFFTMAALLIFRSFENVAISPAERIAWLPENFDKEKATQLAGVAVGPIFPWYFLLQGICACLALATAQLADVLDYLRKCPAPQARKRMGMMSPD